MVNGKDGAPDGTFKFSPSLQHRHLLDSLEPELAYKGGDVGAWQGKLRKKLNELVGEIPAQRPPLNVRTLWKRKITVGDGQGNIEKIVFTGESHSDVPAYVCIPENASPPYDFMICLQGHSSGMHNEILVDKNDETRPISSPKKGAARALGCMENGMAALCIEQRGFGERQEKVQERIGPQCVDTAMHALMLGRTLVGERVFDVDRGIEYLTARGDVHVKTLGITGNSGGGTTAVYAAALLPRLKFAMPSCSFGSYGRSKMVTHHCPCGYIPHILQYAEMADVMGLFAPRPVVIVAGKYDDIVPFDAVQEGFSRLQDIYAAAGAKDQCHLYIGEEGHRFYEEAWPYAVEAIEKLKE